LLSIPTNHNTFDFAYVDADKPNYLSYFDKLSLLIKPGGFIMFDNVLWSGSVVDEAKRKEDEATRVLYEVVQKALNDSRFHTHAINFSDGLCIAQKKFDIV
jgi:caffeoyl-CoA O-methyltransferase